MNPLPGVDHFAALYPGSTTHRALEAEVKLRKHLLPRLPTRAELDACDDMPPELPPPPTPARECRAKATQERN